MKTAENILHENTAYEDMDDDILKSLLNAMTEYASQQVAAERERIKKDVNSWCDEMWTITTEQQERLLKIIDSL